MVLEKLVRSYTKSLFRDSQTSGKVEGEVQMKLIQYTHDDGQTVWFWTNDKEVALSPQFDTKARAEEWYGLHDNWLERPAILL
jgi:hypothetical protein